MKKSAAETGLPYEIPLDRLFRKDSSSRKVAERLLTGGPVSRQELSTECHVAVTNINRVVAALEKAGATITRTLDGKQAIFEVVSIGFLRCAPGSCQDGIVNHTDEIRPRMEWRHAPTFVSLYSGCGGMDIGFAWAGFRPVWSNDIDPVAVATHMRTLPEHESTCGDIADLRHRPGLGAADLVIGGPPCQGFSVAGRMDPGDPRSKHVWRFLKMVEEVRPRAFVMENVKALARNRRWAVLLEDLCRRSEALGFEVRLHVLNAADFSVPQARERMFLVGIRVGEGTHVPPYADTALSQPTLRDALQSLPAFGTPGNNNACAARITTAKAPVLRRSPWAGMLFNGAGRPMDLDRPAPTLPASMGGNKTPIVDQTQIDRHDRDSWVVSYHRHLWEGGKPRTDVPDGLRRITVEEAAAIQTFPLSMDWVGPQSSRYRQIGNAVPPELAYRVAIAVRSSLGMDSTKPTRRADPRTLTSLID